MTIEIKQLVIRAIVDDRRERRSPDAASAETEAVAVPVRRMTSAANGASTVLARDELIAECTRQVLRQLRKGQGR